jgi:hypothetical protein
MSNDACVVRSLGTSKFVTGTNVVTPIGKGVVYGRESHIRGESGRKSWHTPIQIGRSIRWVQTSEVKKVIQ